jgi:hypothetical protein
MLASEERGYRNAPLYGKASYLTLNYSTENGAPEKCSIHYKLQEQAEKFFMGETL